MRINEVKKPDEVKTALVVAIELLEESLIRLNWSEGVIKRDDFDEPVIHFIRNTESAIEDLKLKAGLLVKSSVDFVGMEGGYYTFSHTRSDGQSRKFQYNPDDKEIYDMCIAKAVELDSDPKFRDRRLKEDKAAKELSKMSSQLSSIMSVDDAVKAIPSEINESNSGQ